MKVHKWLQKHTVHNLQQESAEEWQETKGVNEKRSIGAIELFTKHTKELRHEDRVEQDDRDWLLLPGCFNRRSTLALHGQLFTHTLKYVARLLHVHHLEKESGNARLVQAAWHTTQQQTIECLTYHLSRPGEHCTWIDRSSEYDILGRGTEVRRNKTILEKLVLTSVQRHRGWGCIQLPHDCIWFNSSGESKSNAKLLQFSWVTTERTRPHIFIVSQASQGSRCLLSAFHERYIFGTLSCAHACMLSIAQLDIPAVGLWCVYISAPSHVQRTLRHHTRNQVGSVPSRPFQHFSAPVCLQGDRLVIN